MKCSNRPASGEVDRLLMLPSAADINFFDVSAAGTFLLRRISPTTQVFIKEPKLRLSAPAPAADIAQRSRLLSAQPARASVAESAQVGRSSFEPVVVAEGAKGPIIRKVARVECLFVSRRIAGR